MNRVITLAMAAGALAAGLGSAGQASADPAPLNGKYAAANGSDQFYVTVTSNCPTVTDGCTASLVSNRGWTSVATLTNGRWTYSVTKPDGVICGDGNYADVVIRYSLDATTLAGTITADSNGECPGGQVTQAPIQLTKVG
ncbi:MAG: hypothetical protein WCP30_12075 [Mycobacteriaceae bacterium]